ncbi:MAG TPA: hypothetical protein VFV99_08925 [Kofleriaceae bacterium]|nr:hypothetical protein [Kofleriaceae bacterium]
MASSGKRTRGANKQTPWSRNPDDGVSVLRVGLDTSDPRQRARVEEIFSAAYSIKRAVQRDARDRCRAYWQATHERERGPSAVRDRLGLSRKALENAAYAHLNGAPHLRRFATKALAMHLADSVWTATERHLFGDARGRRAGAPRIGRWYDFQWLPGRARSHRRKRKWETFRLHGTLAGHRAAYTHRDGDFVQPRRLRPVELTTKTCWDYTGPLAVVFSGLADGTLVLPVRLPTAPSNQPMLDHHLADPSKWHKVDLVRHRDPNAEGGWRYEAHLMVLTTPYVSPATAVRRAKVAIESVDRTAGIDVNVSCLAIASHDTGKAMRLTRVERSGEDKQRDRGRRRRERRRQRELERSRRAANRAQYQLSKRQEKRARRRAARGLPPVDEIPMGPRKARADGVPLQRYQRDQLSARFRRTRAAQAAEAEAGARARRDHAREVAAGVVATHGYQLVVEDCTIAAWASSWGTAVAAFTPAMLVAAIDREARAVAAIAGGEGGVARATTRTTALSQHCPCGARVQKRLVDRVHRCPDCGLVGDRDDVAAVLASFVVQIQLGEPTSARVDYAAASDALDEIRRVFGSSYQGWQDTLSESNDLSARDGSFIAWTTSTSDPVAMARRNVGTASCSTLNEPGSRQTTSERARVRTDRSTKYVPRWTYLRDTS